jgi:coenzyme F420-reducing hydrogenase delta subunit
MRSRIPMPSPTTQENSTSVAHERPSITVFVCINSARGGQGPSSRNRHRAAAPGIDWPCEVHEVVVPCVGRLQPEHLLKTFEVGSDVTVVIGCASDNCHYHEGSRRCYRRIEYVGRILGDIGHGAERLICAQLPGSAKQDLAVGEGGTPTAPVLDEASIAAKLEALRELVVERLASLPPNPMHSIMFPETPDSELDEYVASHD